MPAVLALAWWHPVSLAVIVALAAALAAFEIGSMYAARGLRTVPAAGAALAAGLAVRWAVDPPHRGWVDLALVVLAIALLVGQLWARWCEPCVTAAPVVDALEQAHEGWLTLLAVDTDEDEDLARQQSVAALPTAVLYVQGEAVGRFEGSGLDGLSDAIDAALGDD